MLEMQLKKWLCRRRKDNIIFLHEHDMLPKAKLLCLLTVAVAGFKFLSVHGF